MGKISLADQVNIFRSADFILGPHGAAFTNLAFSKPGAKFIEFFPTAITRLHTIASVPFED